MSQHLQTFDFAPGLNLRSVLVKDDPWFVASDVCRALGYRNVSQTLADHVDPEDKSIQTIGLRGSAPAVINEAGLYSLILRSTKPEAKEFKRWVTSVVLPSVRKTGVYIAGQEKVDFSKMNYAEVTQHIEALHAQVAEAATAKWIKSREDRNDYREAMRFFGRTSRKAPSVLKKKAATR